jgi:RNA polymerase sigma factor (sigma-70 family)
MAGDTFGERARAFHAGEIDLNKFFREVRPVLEACAAKMLRHWRAPVSVDREDLVQELMVGCIKPFKRYDPTRDVDVGRYVLWNAHDKAKKWLHKQRGAKLHGNADSNPSRIPTLYDDFSGNDNNHPEPERFISALVTEDTQHGTVVRSEIYRLVFRKTRSRMVRWGVLALEQADGEVDEAAHMLYDDFDVRRRLRLYCEADAHRVIRRTVSYMARNCD